MEPVASPGQRIGLLGGSFNPAHEGHRHISLVALRRLGLDRVWWLVSPQNPLKPSAGMAGLGQRLQRARAVARHPRILATDIERTLGTRYTADTLKALRIRFPGVLFVWVMGADNLPGFTRWKRWTEILQTVPVAIIDRPGYSLRAMASPVAQRYAAFRVPAEDARALAGKTPPAWTLLRERLHPASATAIRLMEARREVSREPSVAHPSGFRPLLLDCLSGREP